MRIHTSLPLYISITTVLYKEGYGCQSGERFDLLTSHATLMSLRQYQQHITKKITYTRKKILSIFKLNNNKLALGIRRRTDVLGVELLQLLNVARVEVVDALALLREHGLADRDEHGNAHGERRAHEALDGERRPQLDVLVDPSPKVERLLAFVL
jgi:hypothetical protein